MPCIRSKMASKKIALIGSGNPLFKDEGLGVFVSRYLHVNYTFSQPIEFVDGSTLGLDLQNYIQDYDKLIIINTNSDSSLKAGTITIKELDEFLKGQTTKQTASEVIMAEMIQVCMFAGDIADMLFISITPEDLISVEIGLSRHLITIWDNLIQGVLDQIRNLNINMVKVNAIPIEDMFSLDFYVPTR